MQIVQSAERVGQFTKAFAVKAKSKDVYRKVAAPLVIFKCSGLNYRLARIAVVAFLARADEFYLATFVFNLRRSEIPENRKVRPPAPLVADGAGHVDSASNYKNVDVF